MNNSTTDIAMCGVANPGGTPCPQPKGHTGGHDPAAYGPPTNTPILDDDAIAKIETSAKQGFKISAEVALDLCATVRALRFQLDQVEKAFELEGALKLSEVGDLNALQIIKKLTSLQSQLEQVTKERDELRQQLNPSRPIPGRDWPKSWWG